MNRRLHISRRGFLKLGASAVAATAGARLLPAWKGRVLSPLSAADAASLTSPAPTIFKHLIGSDGWISIPMGEIKNELNAVVAPDVLAPVGRTTYIFGFRDVTPIDGGLPSAPVDPRILAQRGHVQHSAPLMYFDEGDA